MIKVDIYGGLGNQLFQYALGRSISIAKGESLQLFVDRYESYKLRDFLLDNFNICADIHCNSFVNLQKIRQAKCILLKNIFKCKYNGLFGTYYDVDPYKYDSRVFDTKAKHFEGYWQSYKYFEKYQNHLQRELSLKVPLTESNKNILTDIKASNSVSLHIRRGDYVNNPKVMNGVLNLDYYVKAIGLITKKIQNPKFFIFSDDIDWAKKNLMISFPNTFVDVNSVSKPHFDLELMRSCDHNIIANSTLSWWGAFLNSNKNKIVVCPNNWMKFSIDINNLVPSNWNIL